MNDVPPPRASPSPAFDSLETPSGVYRAVQSSSEEIARTALSTKIQWGAIGAVCLSIATGFGWSINKMDVVNTASAQTQATATAALAASAQNAARIDAVDAGTRMALERMERKIDASDEKMERKMAEILRAVKAR